jgi:hypothetical protein
MFSLVLAVLRSLAAGFHARRHLVLETVMPGVDQTENL